MANNHNTPTRILIEVHTSSPTLDKSSDRTFTITLTARVDHHRPVTIDTFTTILYSRSTALDHQGLTFKDTTTSTHAERRHFHVQWQVSDELTATSDTVVQLPPRDAAEGYIVSHTFQTSAAEVPYTSLEGLSDFQKELVAGVNQVCDQTVGLLPGHTYEIGLGTDMASVRWWREGNRAEVFLRGALGRYAVVGPPLRMEMVNTATFQVLASPG